MIVSFLSLHKLDYICTLYGYNITVECGVLVYDLADMKFYFRVQDDSLVLDGFRCRMDTVTTRDDNVYIEVGEYSTVITPKYVPDELTSIDAYILSAVVPQVMSAYSPV